MLPSVSLIIVNYNGREVLSECLESIAALDWPRERREVILVDNASTDGSVHQAQLLLPELRLLTQSHNIGFAPACNLGAQAATGEYLAFLNNDARVPSDWLKTMLAAFGEVPTDVACVGSTILSWDGRLVDFIGGTLNAYGRGIQQDLGLPYDPVRYHDPRDILFACGGAMLIRQAVFFEVGGFDDDFGAYFEDVDLGWRLWLQGYRVRLAPQAVAYHRLHATGRRLGVHRRFAVSELNALRMIVKNYSDENLQPMLSTSLLLSAQRAVLHGQVQESEYAFPGPPEVSQPGAVEPLPRLAASYMVAMGRLADELPHWLAKRGAVQSRRKRTDQEIFSRFPLALSNPVLPWRRHAITQQANLAAVGAPAYLQPQPARHLLIISHEAVGPKMAGPGVRCLEMARALSDHCRVTLAAPGDPQAEAPGVTLVGYQTYADLEPAINAAGVVLALGQLVARIPRLRQLDRPLIVDWYDPFEIEKLAMVATISAEHWPLVDRESYQDLELQAQAGDFYLCASERQRDLWLGLLLARGRLNYSTVAAHPTARGLIDVVPFGLPATPPQRTGPPLKGRLPGTQATDKMLYWGGGLWQWFDPLTLLEALARVVAKRADVFLYFAAGKHFDSQTVPAMPVYASARQRASDLGLLDRHVFFGDWIPYAERANYLLDADIGLSLHQDGLESRYAFRTRLLDYLWAGLPMIVSRGDPLSELVESHRLGRVLAPGDVSGLTEAILSLLSHNALRAEIAPRATALAETFTWERVVEPVVRFMQQPRFAPDARQALTRLEPVVRVKELEDTLRNLQGGRVMRFLKWIDRLRGLQ